MNPLIEAIFMAEGSNRKLVIYASPGLRVALMPADSTGWDDDVTVNQYPMRRLDPVYLSWLRRHTKAGPIATKLFADLVQEHMPDLLKARAEIPPGYRGPVPYDFTFTHL